MNPQRYQQVFELFTQARQRSPDARAEFLQEACAGDVDLRREIEVLLQADADPLRLESVAAVGGVDQDASRFFIG